MRLSAPDRKRQILDAATRLFATQGYAATTTRQIAAECGVTEAILFRHFPSKEELYWEVIQAKRASRGSLERLDEILTSGMNELEVFTAIARDRLERNFADPTMTRLLLFSTLEKHELSYRFFATYAIEYHEHLAKYIHERVERGIFRRMDPLLAARSFLAMMFYHFLVQELFGGKHVQEFDIGQLSRHIAELWLSGMTSTSSESSPPEEMLGVSVFNGNEKILNAGKKHNGKGEDS